MLPRPLASHHTGPRGLTSPSKLLKAPGIGDEKQVQLTEKHVEIIKGKHGKHISNYGVYWVHATKSNDIEVH